MLYLVFLEGLTLKGWELASEQESVSVCVCHFLQKELTSLSPHLECTGIILKATDYPVLAPCSFLEKRVLG